MYLLFVILNLYVCRGHVSRVGLLCLRFSRMSYIQLTTGDKAAFKDVHIMTVSLLSCINIFYTIYNLTLN